MLNRNEYRKYDPLNEAILTGKSGALLVIDRYGTDDFSVWWTDEKHLYDETYGSSIRGNLACILNEIKDEI